MYLYLKALHIIFVTTWFAGLFYIVRLFIYHAEAAHKPAEIKSVLQAQYKVMERRLWYIITWPSAVLAIGFAVGLVLVQPAWLQQPWMRAKLVLVLLLLGYHYRCHQMFLKFQRDRANFRPNRLRIWNEIATVLLFAIVFLAVLKSALDWIWGAAGLMLLGVALMLGIQGYKNFRSRHER